MAEESADYIRGWKDGKRYSPYAEEDRRRWALEMAAKLGTAQCAGSLVSLAMEIDEYAKHGALPE